LLEWGIDGQAGDVEAAGYWYNGRVCFLVRSFLVFRGVPVRERGILSRDRSIAKGLQ
jgi:hypothetical protein